MGNKATLLANMPWMNGSHTDPGYFSQKLTTLFCSWVANVLSESNQQVDNEKIMRARA